MVDYVDILLLIMFPCSTDYVVKEQIFTAVLIYRLKKLQRHKWCVLKAYLFLPWKGISMYLSQFMRKKHAQFIS